MNITIAQTITITKGIDLMIKEEFLQKISDADSAYEWAMNHIYEIIKSLDKECKEFIKVLSPDKINIIGDEFYLSEKHYVCNDDCWEDCSDNFPLDLLFYTTEEAVAYIKEKVAEEKKELMQKFLKEKQKKEEEERELYKQLKEKYENE